MSAAALGARRGQEDGLAAWIAPEHTALLVIDIQVDFASPAGALGLAGVDLTAVPTAIEAAQALAAQARAAGTPVVFVGLQTRPETDSPAWGEWARRRGDGDPPPLCREGQPGAAFYGPQPLAGELVIGKARYSGFHGTNLDAALKARGVDTLVVCGLTTECCIDCTVRDAFHRDYHVFLAADACAAYEPDLHAGSLRALALNCAIPVATAAILAAWKDAR